MPRPRPVEALLRLPSRLLVAFVRAYQLLLSPHMGGGCRFTPTCSNYAIQALEKYGALKGSILAIHRILRCNPWGGHGWDPPRWYGEPPRPPETEGTPQPDHAHPLPGTP